MLNENFWIFLSFVVFLLLVFKNLKRAVLSALDEKIKSVEISIVDAESLKNASNKKLSFLEAQYETAIKEYNLALDEAKVEAEKIILETEEKVKALDEKVISLFEEYKNQSQEVMIEGLKCDILMTVLKLIEQDYEENQQKQLKSVTDNINLTKKIWN